LLVTQDSMLWLLLKRLEVEREVWAVGIVYGDSSSLPGQCR
jgi:hypothetical protein